MESASNRAKKLGSVELGLAHSANQKTQDRLVWSAKPSSGLPALVSVGKAISRTDWADAKWSVVRKGGAPGASYPQSAKFSWLELDRRRLLLCGATNAVYEVVLPEPTVNEETNAFYPIRLRCEVAGLEILSKPFFVLSPESVPSMTKHALQVLDEWFLDPDMGLISVVQSSLVRPKSLASSFLKRHSMASASRGLSNPSSLSQGGGGSSGGLLNDRFSAVDDKQIRGVRAKFEGGGDTTALFLLEKIYPVPVPIDNVTLLVAVSQIFHFTHESITWLGDSSKTEKLFPRKAMISGNVESKRDALHVYGSIVPCKGMYQHLNPRLKIPFESLCTALKVILAANGLPRSWLENDGKVVELTDDQVKSRQFSPYDEVFKNGDKAVFNANTALEALSRSVLVSGSGALVIDYSIVVPVLVNTLSDLADFFAHLSNSRLRKAVSHCTEQLFSAQAVVTEIGNELAALQEERNVTEAAESVHALATKHMATLLKGVYKQLPLHVTQGTDFDCFLMPSFDLYENADESESAATGTILDFSELIESELTAFRLCMKSVSGGGKTTLCRYIAREWAAGHKLFNGKFDLILLISLDTCTSAGYSDLQQVSLVDIVYREFVRPNEDLSALLTDKEDVRNWLAGTGGRILWLLDGVDTLEEFVSNPNNARSSAAEPSAFSPATSPAPTEQTTSGTVTTLPTTEEQKAEKKSSDSSDNNNNTASDPASAAVVPSTPAPSSSSAPQFSSSIVGEFNVRDLLASLEANTDTLVKHRIVTTQIGSRSRISADLYLMIRFFSKQECKQYISKFFPQEEVKLASVVPNDGQVHLEEPKTPSPVSEDALYEGDAERQLEEETKDLSERAKRVWLNMEKYNLLARDMLRIPLNLELVCASYLSDPEYNLKPDEALADFYGHLYGWLIKSANIDAALLPKFESQVQKLAYLSLFKSKFACPTLGAKILKNVSREFRNTILDLRFFESVSVCGKGYRFVHSRVQEYLAARFICADENFSAEMLSRLRAKVINRAYHSVFLLLVGLLRQDKEKLMRLFEVLLIGEQEITLLGQRGPAFVLRCFEEAALDRQLRTAVIDWFWKNFGMPKIHFWKSNLVVNLLELIIFKLAKKDETETMEYKSKAIVALGKLGMDSARVVHILTRAAKMYPELMGDVVGAIQAISTTNLNVIPVIFDAMRSKDKKVLQVCVTELRRLILPPEDLRAEKSSVMRTAVTKLVRIAMSCFDAKGVPENDQVLADILQSLAAWRWGDDSVLPLLVKCLERDEPLVQRAAISVVQYVDLLGPNVFYNEKLISRLESIGKRDAAMRGDVAQCFLCLGMESDFVRELLRSGVSQSDDVKLAVRSMLLCAQFYVTHSSVVEALAKVAIESLDQQLRRVAIDVLAYVHLPRYTGDQAGSSLASDVNAALDALYALGVQSKFVTHRVQRMTEKKRKSTHMQFNDFAAKYIF